MSQFQSDIDSRALQNDYGAPESSNSRKRSADEMSSSIQNDEHQQYGNLDFPESAYAEPDPTKVKSTYPWVAIMGGPCHSEREENSGQNLSETSKTYRKMQCLYCTNYNPGTAWASLKPRKFIVETFIEHEKSLHHLRSLQLHAESPPVMTQPIPMAPLENEQTMAEYFYGQMPIPVGNTGNHHSQQHHADSDSSDEEMMDSLHEVSMNNPASVSATALANMARGLPMPLPSHGQHSLPPHLMLQAQEQARKKPNLGMPLDANGRPIAVFPMETKAKFAPDWLRVEGKLCYSDKQTINGKDLTGVKKKYKHVMCAYCAAFNPSSPWAILKARKYESSVLAEHERSHNHKKAVTMREAAMQNNGGYRGELVEVPMDMNMELPVPVPVQQFHTSSGQQVQLSAVEVQYIMQQQKQLAYQRMVTQVNPHQQPGIPQQLPLHMQQLHAQIQQHEQQMVAAAAATQQQQSSLAECLAMAAHAAAAEQQQQPAHPSQTQQATAGQVQQHQQSAGSQQQAQVDIDN